MNQNKRKSVLCIRVDSEELRAIDAIAAMKVCRRSEWLRTVIYAAVRAECVAMVSSPSAKSYSDGLTNG